MNVVFFEFPYSILLSSILIEQYSPDTEDQIRPMEVWSSAQEIQAKSHGFNQFSKQVKGLCILWVAQAPVGSIDWSANEQKSVSKQG